MATVYLAEDVKHRRRVALKLLRPELAQALGPERFLREIETTAALHHPHILPLYDSGEADGFLFYVMPYVEGESLRDRLDRERQLPLDDALQIAREVADALSYAHSRGVIHRDIKPENILLEAGHAVVADFGIAKAISSAGADMLTREGVAIGTPQYMSPEQAAGEREVDGRSDLYSLGCVLYEMLAGQPPFTGPTAESLVRQHLTADPPAVTHMRPTVPASVAETLKQVLAKTPADRLSPAAAFADALDPRTTVPSAAKPTRRWTLPVAAAAFVLLGAAAVVLWRAGSGASGDRPGLVVLPFENLGAPEEEYFADGMTEEVTSRLAEISGLGVISRTSALLYKGRDKSLKEIGAELGVRFVLEGTVRTDRAPRGEGQVRVTSQLIRVSDDTHLWSDRHTASLAPGEVFRAQSEIAERVATALEVRLLGAERQAVRQVLTTDREAHDAYLQGRFYWNKRTPPDLERAVTHFTAATERDPQFARAWAGLADTYAVLPTHGITLVSRAEAYRRAEDAARRATALDPTLGEAHASLALARMYGAWDWGGAEREFRRAIELDPDYPVAHYWYTELLLALGRMDEAVAHAERAVALAPAAAVAQHLLGWSLAIAGHRDSAEIFLRKALELEPDFTMQRIPLALNAVRDGRYDEGERLLGGVMKYQPFIPAILDAWHNPANRPAAIRAIGAAARAAPGRVRDPADIAVAFGMVGATDSAVAWYERAFRERTEGLVYSIWFRPWLPHVVDDPRIVALRRRAGLPN